MSEYQIQSGPAHDYVMPWFVRLLGGRFRDGRAEYRMKWGSLGWRNGWGFALCLFEEGFTLKLHLFANAFIKLPFLRRFAWDPYEIMESWGASYHTEDGALHFSWGRGYKIFWMPWRNWVQVAHDVRRADGSWAPYVGSWERDKEPDGRQTETYPYRYMLRSGEVQTRTATIYVERRARRLKLLRAVPLFTRTSYAIEVEFSDEVGDRTGSWKGGCVGCGYDLRPDETPRECLRRMERERKFR